jgi:hypothetical protein
MWCGEGASDGSLGIQDGVTSSSVRAWIAGTVWGSRRVAMRRTGVVLHRPFQGAALHNMFHTAKHQEETARNTVQANTNRVVLPGASDECRRRCRTGQAPSSSSNVAHALPARSGGMLSASS